MGSDLLVAVTAHDETAVAGPTMHSVELAIAEVRARGFSVDQLIALDSPTDATAAYFGHGDFDDWQRRRWDVGDVGLLRNEVVRQSDCDFIAFLDADDLFSRNWLAEAMAASISTLDEPARVIAHPELNVVFDAHRAVVVNPDSTSPLFTPHYLYARNYYDSLCLAPRRAYLEHPYLARDIPNGLSFQDFRFTIETLAAGWRHLVVRDTIIFKRRRDDSLFAESTGRRAIVHGHPSMLIDQVSGLGTRSTDDRSP